MTFQPYTPFTNFVEMESLLPSPIRRVCEYLLTLPRQPRPMSSFSQVTHRVGLESVHTLVGKEPLLEEQWLLPQLASARQIDLVNYYRINEDLIRALREFSSRPDNRLRVCFMDAWDEPLVAIHNRKVGHDAEYMQRAVNRSLAYVFELFGLPDSSDFRRPHLPTGCPASLLAHYQVYLSKQRITYSYCRIDDQALIVPLDVKTAKEDRPPAWAISKAICPAAFDYYLQDIEKMLTDADLKPLKYDSRQT